MKLADLIKQYEATRDLLRAQNHPDATAYDVLIANARRMLAEFQSAMAQKERT